MFKKVFISKNIIYSLFRCVSLLALGSLWSYAVAEPLVENANWNGELSFVVVGYSQKSQFAGDDDNQRTADLNNSGKTSTSVGALPLFHLNYTLNDLQTQIFLGNDQGDNFPHVQFAIEFGLTHSFGQSDKLSFALLPKFPFLGETWKDPFLIGQDRQKTNEEVEGLRLKFEHGGNNPFEVQYAFARSQVNVEESGNALVYLSHQERDMLNRNADFHRFSLNVKCPINQEIMLIPNFYVTTSDAKGNANDFADGVFKLQSLYIKEKHIFSATLGIGRKESNIDNPIFNRPQNDKSLSFDALYKYTEPLGYKNLSLLSVVVWKKSDSNITFYNSQSAVFGVGLGYTW